MSNEEYEREFQRRFAAPRKLTQREARQIARSIQRLERLEEKVKRVPLHRDTLKVFQWAKQFNAERLGKLTDKDALAKVAFEMKRPYRTDLHKQFASVHDQLCRENGGQLPNYGEAKRRLEEKYHKRHSIRTLRRRNKSEWHLPMSGKVGRPKKMVTKKRNHGATISAMQSVFGSRRDDDRSRATRN
jgi:hypothetical protein